MSKQSQQNSPSIFNDVIGPVMRGPSSSHCAAALRIGRLARDLMNGEIKQVTIEFDPKGSLATTHESQGSDMGLFGGLLGWDATDERLEKSNEAIEEAGIDVQIQIRDIGATHPNTYEMELKNETETHRITAVSTGGGMIEVTEIDGVTICIAGDYYETLIYLSSGADQAGKILAGDFKADEIQYLKGGGFELLEVKANQFVDQTNLARLSSSFEVIDIKKLAPVLPVLSGSQNQVPFSTCAEMLAFNLDLDLPLWELAMRYESARAGISSQEVFTRMQEVVRTMRDSINQGIKGTHYEDRILGYQSGNFREQMDAGKLLDGGMLNRMILYISAMMEVKSSMGVIVAAPTAGACGGLPGAVIAAGDALGFGIDEMTKAMFAAGIIGVFIAEKATFAAEVCGCQAECGAGSSMAAAALVNLNGGSAQQAVDAASMALQNVLGLICDPVANRVEVPCLGRNVMAASNALACANMGLAGYDVVIPLDEVIETMYRVGQSLPYELRCTGLGGLSVTKASKAIEQQLQ